MRLTKVIFCTLTLFLLTIQAGAQFFPKKHLPPSRNNPLYDAPDTVPVTRWVLSANPLGVLEGPAAFGAGIGYRLNARWELWEESSLLAGLIYGPSAMTGFRQILQAKYFVLKPLNSFLAIDLRYKQFTFPNDSGAFVNAALHDTLRPVGFGLNRHFFAVGLQVGRRIKLSRDGRWQLELTVGLGVKFASVRRTGTGIPPGYTYFDQYYGDLKADSFWETPGATEYFPGSFRLLYTFGSRLP